MDIVLHRPEIPHNTGAVGRTALVAGSSLHLIHPLGFRIDEKSLRRCGLDYWPRLDVREYGSFGDFLLANPGRPVYPVETGAGRLYTDARYRPDGFLLFGGETAGLPGHIMERFGKDAVRIPMHGGERSLNLSVAVGVVLFEALRQAGFGGRAV